MPIDPSFLPPAASPDELAEPLPVVGMNDIPASGVTPNLGHTLVFAILVAVAGFVVGLIFALVVMHVAPHMHESAEQMQSDPLLVIPVEAVIYAIAAAASFLIFPLFWNRPFGQGVHFHAFVARSRWWVLAAIGVATSVVVQVLSNFLPIPKELPIDKFFTHPLGVWLIAVFGVTVAPAFEELAFRGFLLPSLASAWDWVVQGRVRRRYAGESGGSLTGEWQQQAPVYSSLPPDGASVFQAAGTEPDAGNTMRDSGYSDPRWSWPALVFSTIVTSIGFAMLHGAQLAHSFAPLSVLFAVSVVLCITRLRFHSLAASTVVHSMYNATIFVMLFIGTDGFRHLDKLGK
ncbi:MAG: CPBP family intramembrane glutamic endopeptidase [Acidobacteriaceae bacterium]